MNTWRMPSVFMLSVFILLVSRDTKRTVSLTGIAPLRHTRDEDLSHLCLSNNTKYRSVLCDVHAPLSSCVPKHMHLFMYVFIIYLFIYFNYSREFYNNIIFVLHYFNKMVPLAPPPPPPSKVSYCILAHHGHCTGMPSGPFRVRTLRIEG